ncbi:hypothetical protein SG34_025580 [Thalassomonas viridans]|uniref:Uncharacterized protein n=1 Tax=Thalassomonas viridans TaxID=137584 RepID=A0AAE9Z0N8_9GAMM|nr:hypothetical protein [Thalassomonas viridans]WDE04661.1 hypothetical protein SG34_025580 [Thalassomonas viridans]
MTTTISASVQSLLTKLKAGAEAEMTAEELLLLSKSVQVLSDNEDFEQALIAVAEGHLDTATAAVANATSAAESANSSLQQSAANLDLIPQVESQLTESVAELKKAVQASLDSRVKTLMGIASIEEGAASADNIRSSAVFAVYDASGDSYLVRPSYTYNTSNTESRRLEYLKLPSSGVSKSTLATHFVYRTTFEQNPETNIYYYGSSAILPLARKGDSEDIEYDIVYSSQSSATSSISAYAGIFCKSAGYTSATKPKIDINATDQWGIQTNTNHNWQNPRVLYDNNKHCLLIVDFDTGLLVEKYRDGNVVTTTEITHGEALQTYVDNGDFTVICFISHRLSWLLAQHRGTSTEETTNNSHVFDYSGFYGVLDGEVKMGSNKYSAHYRFTTDKKLEPLVYSFTSTVAYVSTNAYLTGEVTAALNDMAGNTLGIYRFKASSDYPAQHPGHMASAIVCINPYSQVGILNEHGINHNNTSRYGLGRTCKAF